MQPKKVSTTKPASKPRLVDVGKVRNMGAATVIANATKGRKPTAEEVATVAALTGDTATAIDYRAAGLDNEFADAVKYRQSIDEKIKALEQEKKDWTETIQAYLDASDHKSVAVDDYRVTLVPGKKGSAKIDAKLLLAEGVTVTQIAKATVVGEPGKPYVLVTKGKEAK